MNFRQKVYAIVKTIPKGQVITYKQIGEKLNSKAYQAIGQALKNNSDPENIPCHRVIKSNGEVGGYFGHIDDDLSKKKEELLRNEGIKIVDGKVVRN
ncbi:MAG: MGMT family protein [Candidatus Shapirobacteria bacterium]|nr:MGMT family protein [Candidatus Shapirobacteria bacterium]